MKSFYLGSAITNFKKAAKLIEALEAQGWTCTYNWTKAIAKEGSATAKEEQRQIAQAEVKGVQDADVMVLFLPAGRGAHVELGVALGFHIPTLVLYSYEGQLLGGYGYDCIFYSHEVVNMWRYPDEDPSPTHVSNLMTTMLAATLLREENDHD